MISRTMGLEIGAAIGVLFFLANVVGSALFATGVAEGLFNRDIPAPEISNIKIVVQLILALVGLGISCTKPDDG